MEAKGTNCKQNAEKTGEERVRWLTEIPKESNIGDVQAKWALD